MRLYIGKSQEQDDTPVKSIFRLIGNDEDALTYALGFLLAHDASFCYKLVRSFRPGRIKRSKEFPSSYSIHLQEVTDALSGRRDVVIESKICGIRIVLEAKLGQAVPGVEQIRKYARDSRWDTFESRMLVSLTQVRFPKSRREEIKKELGESIVFRDFQWHQIIDLVIRHMPTVGSEVKKHFHNEFLEFIMGDYSMGYYDSEIYIQDVNPLNRCIFESGWMYVDGLKSKKAPLYFAPYFTEATGDGGISKISRVIDIQEIDKAELIHERVVDSRDLNGARTEEYRDRWRYGLRKIIDRALNEDDWLDRVRLFYLDKPIGFMDPPLKKTEAGWNSQIASGFSRTFYELLRMRAHSNSDS